MCSISCLIILCLLGQSAFSFASPVHDSFVKSNDLNQDVTNLSEKEIEYLQSSLVFLKPTKEIDVDIRISVNNIEISELMPMVTVNQKVRLEAVVDKKNCFRELSYNWMLGKTPINTSDVPFLFYKFPTATKYFIVLMVSGKPNCTIEKLDPDSKDEENEDVIYIGIKTRELKVTNLKGLYEVEPDDDDPKYNRILDEISKRHMEHIKHLKYLHPGPVIQKRIDWVLDHHLYTTLKPYTDDRVTSPEIIVPSNTLEPSVEPDMTRSTLFMMIWITVIAMVCFFAIGTIGQHFYSQYQAYQSLLQVSPNEDFFGNNQRPIDEFEQTYVCMHDRKSQVFYNSKTDSTLVSLASACFSQNSAQNNACRHEYQDPAAFAASNMGSIMDKNNITTSNTNEPVTELEMVLSKPASEHDFKRCVQIFPESCVQNIPNSSVGSHTRGFDSAKWNKTKSVRNKSYGTK